MNAPAELHIAVGVVSDDRGRILISQRKDNCAYAGQWEFPGGKCEPGESVEQALARELYEELGLLVGDARPLIEIRHSYPDRQVRLDTWRVLSWSGQAMAREGQNFVWVEPAGLDHYPMLAANGPIVHAAQLPDRYLITPDPVTPEAFLPTLERALAGGIRMLRLRAPSLPDAEYGDLAGRVVVLARQYAAEVLLDRSAEMVKAVGASGLHLTAHRLSSLKRRPLPEPYWLAGSCHDRRELKHLQEIGGDFAVLGPVSATPSHPGARLMGWPGFAEERNGCRLPVYALGGMHRGDLPTAWSRGGQGIAAIRSLWEPASQVTGISLS